MMSGTSATLDMSKTSTTLSSLKLSEFNGPTNVSSHLGDANTEDSGLGLIYEDIAASDLFQGWNNYFQDVSEVLSGLEDMTGDEKGFLVEFLLGNFFNPFVNHLDTGALDNLLVEANIGMEIMDDESASDVDDAATNNAGDDDDANDSSWMTTPHGDDIAMSSSLETNLPDMTGDAWIDDGENDIIVLI
jgi:hypothetical protein